MGKEQKTVTTFYRFTSSYRFFFLVFSNDLRIYCEPIASTNPCVYEEALPDSRLKDGISTGRVDRDVGSATFQANIYPVQVDLTKWTRHFETKFAEFTRLVDFRFNATDLLMQGLEERFDVMERRQNNTERQTSVHLQKIQQRFVQYESHSNDSKHKTEKRIEELENRINLQCSRPTEEPSLLTTLTAGSGTHHTVSPGPSIAPPAGDWILIQKHNFLDKDAFKDKLWVDYKDGFGDGINEFWFGLKKMHDYTKNGLWLLKVAFTYDLNKHGRPLTRRYDPYHRGDRAYGIYTHFHIDSEDDRFRFHVSKRIEVENWDRNIRFDPVETTISSKGFYTKDKDLKMSKIYLASRYGGGWWFDSHNYGFGFCANCQRDLVMKKKAPWESDLAIWKPWRDSGYNPSEISMFMQRVN